MVLQLFLSGIGDGAGTVGAGVIDGIFAGLTDLHPVLSLILACLEGSLIGGAFGALIGALKFDPSKQDYEMKPKKEKRAKKGKKGKDEFSDMSFFVWSHLFGWESYQKMPSLRGQH